MTKFYLPLFAAAAIAAPLQAGDFDNGFFIMNEEGSGVTGNGSINYFEPGTVADGDCTWKYRADRAANPDREIPGAITHAVISGGKMYVVSNHPIEDGSYSMTGTLTVLDAETLQFIASHELVNSRDELVQGRAAIAAPDGKILVTTTNGILKYDPATDAMVPSLAGVMGTDTDPQPYQYPLQTGMMVRVGEKIYVASQTKGLIIIDPTNDTMSTRTLSEMFGNFFPDDLDKGFGSVVKDNEGNLWMSVTADIDATGDAAPSLVQYNPVTGEARRIVIPQGIYPPANSWYAWTADGFHYSTKNNALYWNGGASTWFSNQRIYKYDLAAGEFSRVISIAHEDMEVDPDCPEYYIYGCSMRSCPETGDMYVSLFKDYGSTEYELMRIDADGTAVHRYSMQPEYWFPSYILFPKGEDAGVRSVAADRLAAGCTIELAGKSLNLGNPTPSALPLQVYTPAGALVATRTVLPGECNIPLTSLPSGVYLVRLGSAAISVRL